VVDKRMTPQEVVAQIKDGDTVAIGGWGPFSKPMVLVREIVKSKLKDLTIISFAGIDIDMLIGAGKVKKLIFAFVSLEGAPGVPMNYRRARSSGSIETMELSEWMQIAGLKAAAQRIPFIPTRNGIGTDILTTNPQIKMIECPYTKEKLVAMPALKPDVALIHVSAAEKMGYGRILPNPYFDPVMARAADKTFLSAERIISLSELKSDYNHVEILKIWTTGVVEAPMGAHPGDMWPDYEWDVAHLTEYSKAAADPEAFKKYLDKYVYGAPDQEAYLKLVGKR
jgi:glutaconate CoA-transferase subunit A